MKRPLESTVETCLSVFQEERVGALSWGLVNGKTKTDLPWGSKPESPGPKVWQHDLFRTDHPPYNVSELELFRQAIHKVGTH